MKRLRRRIKPHKHHAVTGGPTGQPGIPPGKSYANGDIWCQTRQRRIEPVICTIQSFREPKKCDGCRYTEEETRKTNSKEVHV